MYIRYLCAEFDTHLRDVVLVCVSCVCLSVHTCVRVYLWLHNLTRDYMSLTELMSKSTGSALGLTGGRAERKGDLMGVRQREVERQRERE